MVKSKFIKLFFFFEWQDFCMDFNQKIRFGGDFIVSVSDNEPSRYVRKCPLLAKIVHARLLWRHFFYHSRLNKFWPLTSSIQANFSSAEFVDWVNSACQGKFCLYPTYCWRIKSFRQIPLPPAAMPDQDAHIALLCVGPHGRALSALRRGNSRN